MVPRFQNWKKKYFEIFFQIFSRFWNFGALFIVKQRFLKQIFLKKGWLGFAHIRSTCGPDLPRAATHSDLMTHFVEGLPRKKVRCVSALHRCNLALVPAHHDHKTHHQSSSVSIGARSYQVPQHLPLKIINLLWV